MGNNQNQIIKQALEILSENNRFALKSITNDAAIKTNFYKLSDVDIRPELRKELEETEKPKSDLEKRFHDIDLEDNPKPVDPEAEDKPEDESFKKNKPREPRKKTLYEKLRDLTIKNQIDAIKDLHGIDVTGLSQKEIAELLEVNYSPGPDMPASKIVNTDLGRNRR